MYRNFSPCATPWGKKNGFLWKMLSEKCFRRRRNSSRLVIQKIVFSWASLLLLRLMEFHISRRHRKIPVTAYKIYELKRRRNSHILNIKILGTTWPNSSRWGTRAEAPSRRLHRCTWRKRRADGKSFRCEMCWWDRRSPGSARPQPDPSRTPAPRLRIETSPSTTLGARTGGPTRDDPSSKSAPAALEMGKESKNH